MNEQQQIRHCERCGAEIAFNKRRRAEYARKRFCSVRCSTFKRNGQSLSTHGYVVVRRAVGDRTFEHIVVAERAVGHQLPPGAVVHHIDRNRTNNQNSNLVVCEDAGYHKLIHARQAITELGGHPDCDAICRTCQRLLPLDEFNLDSRKWNNHSYACRHCERLRKSRDKRRTKR